MNTQLQLALYIIDNRLSRKKEHNKSWMEVSSHYIQYRSSIHHTDHGVVVLTEPTPLLSSISSMVEIQYLSTCSRTAILLVLLVMVESCVMGPCIIGACVVGACFVGACVMWGCIVGPCFVGACGATSITGEEMLCLSILLCLPLNPR